MNVSFPALYLYPLNDSFAPKHISLVPGQHVKIGRQTNAKTTPGERNGYFDSKVLSRQHAEVWTDAEKIFIKDVKSSNGTFINGERLSLEGLESEPFELKTDDIVEFGIDIVGEDNKTIIHHKVAARVFCVLSEQDAQVAARAEQRSQQQQQQQQVSAASGPGGQSPFQQQHQPAGGAGGSFNFGPQPGPRRPMNSGLSGMGGMGASMRPPGKSGLTFEHIVSRLQGEIQKSRETGAELHTLTGAMGEIHDTLGGNLPPTVAAYPPSLPMARLPMQPPQPQPLQSAPQQTSPESTSPTEQSQAQTSNTLPPPTILSELQTQLAETQASLSSQLDRIHALENALHESESVKQEFHLLREKLTKGRPEPGTSFDDDDDDFRGDIDDDARSIATAVPHELDRVEEEEEEENAEGEHHLSQEHSDEEELDPEHEAARLRHQQHVDEQPMGRPHTPEPNSLGMSSSLRSGADFQPHSPPDTSVIDDLTSKLTSLASQLESALELSSSLQAQHTAAQSTISILEAKVEKLEELVQAAADSSAPPPASPPPPAPTAASDIETPVGSSLFAMLNDWKKSVEGQWSSVQEEWKAERERLAKAREEWEAKARELDLRNASTASWAMLNGGPNHEKRNGLVTPPSPRSLSADSNKRTRKRRAARSRSRSRGSRYDSHDTDSTLASEESGTTKVETEGLGSKEKFGLMEPSLPTPESSMRGSLASSLDPAEGSPGGNSRSDEKKGEGGNLVLGGTQDSNKQLGEMPPNMNVQTAVGVVVLSMAAAAVIWRVKPMQST